MIRAILFLTASSAFLTGCSSDSNVEAYVTDVKNNVSGRITPLPEYDKVSAVRYEAYSMRSPFELSQDALSDSKKEQRLGRLREVLEQFPLDALTMRGTIESQQVLWGLIEDKDGKMYQVQEGNYIGLNEGMIIEINPRTIKIVEKHERKNGIIEEQTKYLTLQN